MSLPPTIDRSIFDAIPAAVFVVDEDMRVQELNAAATQFCAEDQHTVTLGRSGDVLRCLHSSETPEGCGSAVACSSCVIRNSVNLCLLGKTISRKRMNLQAERAESLKEFALLITAVPLPGSDERFALVMVEDITELTTLQRIIPICMKCKKIRDDEQYWRNLEEYFREHAGVEFTHGLCPTCLYEVYPDAREAPPSEL